MIASFLAAFFFALNATCASHSVRTLGPARANLGRLMVATAILGTFAHLWGGGFASASLSWFLLSGIIGMGLGDLGVYGALPHLGSRLTVLMTQCLAAPLAALGEWLWLGTRLTAVQLAWGLLILAGVTLAISPSRSSPPRVRIRPVGFLFGFIAACGQGFGALVSRKGVNVAEAAGEAAHNATFGLTAAYQRILAGLVFTAGWFLLMRLLGRLDPLPHPLGACPQPALRPQPVPGSGTAAAACPSAGTATACPQSAPPDAGPSFRTESTCPSSGRPDHLQPVPSPHPSPGSIPADSSLSPISSLSPFADQAWRRRALGWMLANGMAGPVLGVGCYQWALATTPSGIVLPIAATAPLLAIPIAFLLEGDRPTRRALLGGVLAVAGCIALTLGR